MTAADTLDTFPAVLRPRITDIQAVVASHFGLPISAMSSPCRLRCLARPRQIAMALCRELTERSLPSIGAAFGGRDHTTVMHAIQRVAELAAADPEFADELAALREQAKKAA